MHEYVLTMLAAASVTYLLTPLVRRFAIAIGASHAARDRDVHRVPTPLLGGAAMYAGLAAGLLVAGQLPALKTVFAQTNMARGLLLAGGLVVIMGFVDDRWGMGVISKLAGQVAAGVILVWSGAEVTWLPEPAGGTLALTSDQQTAVTILVVVVTINAVNFIDGLDGLAAGIVAIGAVAFFIYYYTLTQRLSLPDQTGPALASAVLAGMCLGFLPHNFHPARIFMGDTGAMLIGLLLAYAPISSLAMLDPGSLTDPAAYGHGTVNRFGAILPLLLPAAILLIPYADLLMAVVRRTRAGMSPFAPDKKHLHHRLLDIGHSHRTTVLIMYLWAALFAGSVVWLSIVETPLLVLAAVTVGGMLALLLVSMPRLRPWARAAADPPSQAAPRPPSPTPAAVPADVPGTPPAAQPPLTPAARRPATGGPVPRGGLRPAAEPAATARPPASAAPPAGPRRVPAEPATAPQPVTWSVVGPESQVTARTARSRTPGEPVTAPRPTIASRPAGTRQPASAAQPAAHAGGSAPAPAWQRVAWPAADPLPVPQADSGQAAEPARVAGTRARPASSPPWPPAPPPPPRPPAAS